MQYIKEQIARNIDVQSMAKFLGLTGVASLLPFLIHLQWVTGPIINAILIITLFIVGMRSALVLCLVPSMMALAGGLLPAVLAPVVPFIMLSNVIFVLVIDWVYNNFKVSNQGYWAGILIGASLKFAFLFFSVNIISKLLIQQTLILKVAQMMSWPQFATAVTGGMIAWVIIKKLKRF